MTPALPTTPLLCLSALPAGHHATVEALEGGREFCTRAANLGFTAGALVKMIQNRGRGPVLVALRGTFVALGRGEAAAVRVRES
jgi:ferrous iron transport protein A